MNPRERFIKSMTFQNPDKITFAPGGARESTLKRWHSEGLPENMNYMDYLAEKLGFALEKPQNPTPHFSVDFRMRPWFEEKILEHRDGHYIVQDWMGAIVEISDKYGVEYLRNAIDFVTRSWIKCPVETHEDWLKMKERYNPNDTGRITALNEEDIRRFNERDSIYQLTLSGPFWQLREWMGFENLCMAFIERPDFVMEMIDFWKDYVNTILKKIVAMGLQIDRMIVNEDIAYKAHCMISPDMVREFLLPSYKSWIGIMRNNVANIDLDSDGCVAELIPIWIEAGFDSNSPVEVAAHNDIVLYRELYGKKMAYRGGIDKREIAKGGKAIEAELKRIIPPLFKDGGFIPSCDHGVPADISLENFVYYSKLLARYTGWL